MEWLWCRLGKQAVCNPGSEVWERPALGAHLGETLFPPLSNRMIIRIEPLAVVRIKEI